VFVGLLGGYVVDELLKYEACGLDELGDDSRGVNTDGRPEGRGVVGVEG
jgi:hypothetical protein